MGTDSLGRCFSIEWCYFINYCFLFSLLKWVSRNRTNSLLGERWWWFEPWSGQALGVTAVGAKIEVSAEVLILGTQKDEVAINCDEQPTVKQHWIGRERKTKNFSVRHVGFKSSLEIQAKPDRWTCKAKSLSSLPSLNWRSTPGKEHRGGIWGHETEWDCSETRIKNIENTKY